MNKLSVIQMPGPAAAVTFLLIFPLCFFGIGSFDRYLARQNLARQAQTVLRAFQETADETRAGLMRLPPLHELDCHNGLSSALSHQAISNPYVRWFAIVRNRQVVCDSSPIDLDITSNYLLHQIDNVWSVLFVPTQEKKGRLFLVQNRGDSQYLALMEPMLFDFEGAVPCRHCVSYELVLHAVPEIAPRFGDTWSQSVIFYTVDGHVGRAGLTLTLAATQAYLDQFHFLGRLLSAAFATIVALAISFAVYSYLGGRRSLSYLVQQGIKHHEFVPFYQPIVDSRTGSVLGAEALAHWRTKSGQLLPPDRFIAFAEDSGLIRSMTDQVIAQALSDLKRFGWQNNGHYISVNVMPDQLTEPSFCDNLLRRVAREGVIPASLSLEITERHQIADLSQGKRALSRLTDAGIHIMLDDAGTGFGGFSYVQELPITTLKIDKMFIDTLLSEGDAKRQVLNAIIEFARISQLNVIAEGVETSEQVAYLAKAGVYAIQGYVYARPMPAHDFLQWTASRRPAVTLPTPP